MPRHTLALLTAAVLIALAPSAAQAKACQPVKNPYPGTEYDGVDLTRIRAEGVGCATARRVARKAHRKALSTTVPPDGIRRLRWHGWRVRGDVRPEIDRYVARKGERRVRWRF